MSGFVDKASSKISKLSTEEICRIITSQNKEIDEKNAILDSFGDGVILVNKEFRILFYNKFSSLVVPFNDLKKNSFNGTKVEKAINDADMVEYMKNCVGKNRNDEEYFYEANTSMFGNLKIRVTSTVIRSIDCVLFKISDITFLSKLRDEFKKNESLAAMTTMAAQVAHEIKNPLASISIYLQLLEKQLEKSNSITKEQAWPSIEVISEEIERLNKIAVDFLFAVRPMKVNLEIANINDVIKKTMVVVKPEMENMEIDIRLDLATSLPKLMIDQNLVQQSVLNLVRNSMQAIETTKKSDGLIRIHSYVEENNVKVEVHDNGCGMSEEQLEKIFEPYYTTKTNGTGLGLTTIFKIMKELDGEVTVTSEYKKGSVFTLSFPIPNSERFKIGQV